MFKTQMSLVTAWTQKVLTLSAEHIKRRPFLWEIQ